MKHQINILKTSQEISHTFVKTTHMPIVKYKLHGNENIIIHYIFNDVHKKSVI